MKEIFKEINNLENQIINKYKDLDVWKLIEDMDKSEISNLILKNYSYSKYFSEIIDVAVESTLYLEGQTAMQHIVEEENTPDEHFLLHTKMLEACGIFIPDSSKMPKSNAIDDLIKASFDYAKPRDENDALSLLCFFRLGSEILAGELYQTLMKIVPDLFNVTNEQILFIQLHAEHDCKTTDLGIKPNGQGDIHGNRPHADFFNTPITQLVRKIGSPKALSIVKDTYERVFLLRKAYVEDLIKP